MSIDKDLFCRTDKCIHRRGCERWVGNYKKEIKAKLWVNSKRCIHSKPYPYTKLIRFRNSADMEGAIL